MPRRLPTPRANGELLVVPSFDAVPRLIQANRQRLDTDQILIDSIPLKDLRQRFRLCGSTTGPVILTGHQPELFHPGVWAKNFAAAGFAKRLGGVAVNLIVDHDELKTTSIRKPCPHPDPNKVHVEEIPFDDVNTGKPYESAVVNNAVMFQQFCQRFGLPLSSSGPWKSADVFTQARQMREASWGCDLVDVHVSELCKGPAFQHFAKHILQNADQFNQVYNIALNNYRQHYRLRSRTHPAPDLEPHEAPFWIINDQGNRRRCFAPYSGDIHHLRPRALSLTLIARLILGDFFIHGIGGGKYDEVTDEIIKEFFHLEPPAFQVVSGTLHLPLEPFPHQQDDVSRLAHTLRDLDWNPDRYLNSKETEFGLRKRKLAEETRPTKDGRRSQFREFREVLTALRPLVDGLKTKTLAELTIAHSETRANAILLSREYAWVLYPVEQIREFLVGTFKQAHGCGLTSS